MSDESGESEKGKQGVQGVTRAAPPMPPARGWTGPPSDEKYLDLWAAYRDGCRRIRPLQRRCKLDPGTVITAIEKGWPERSMPSLRDRLALHERQMRAAAEREMASDREAAERLGKTEARLWKEARVRQEGLSRQLEDILAAFGKKLQQAAPAATFLRYRKVPVAVVEKGKDGVERTVLREQLQSFVDATAYAKALALYAGAVKDAPAITRAILGPAVDEAEPEVPTFTQEQLAEIAAGRMPDGVDQRMIGLALLAAMAGGVPG